MIVIDTHHHFLPRKVYEQFADPNGPPKRIVTERQDFTFNPMLHDADMHLRHMDEGGVDVAVLSIAQFGNSARLEVCRAINDGLAEEMDKHPDRFSAAACIPILEKGAAVAEVERAINELGFQTIALQTSMHPDISPSNREYMWPIYQKAAEEKVTILFHPNLRPPGAELECTINRTVSRGVDAAKTVLRLIYDVSPDFPDLKVIIPHMGGATLALKGRMNAFFEPEEPPKGKPIPENLTPLAKTPRELEEFGLKEPFDNLFDRLYFDGAGSGGWMPIVYLAMMTVRHDRLVWGTDYPYEIHEGRDLKAYVDNVKNMPLPEESKKMFLGQNAQKLLGIGGEL